MITPLIVWFLVSNGSPAKLSMNNIIADTNGILVWAGTSKEVALFGVNYMTPFAYSYRAILDKGLNIQDTIRQDVRHLKRLGLDALRIHVWDREISDLEGNLLDNEHTRAMDYLISECKVNGVYVLLTPLTFYTNGYPGPDLPTPGFSQRWSKSEMASDPKAIAASAKYLAQFANHVNPFTGLAYRNDPTVFGFELCNEPDVPPKANLFPI